ncbi:hypothetical protein AVEN_107165-1 [Araneus ventricosus]|uniref:Uncharacterized protein n=1 Tax=Araneus ventricosus TaxID=182803 RepID=A0A4Y2FGF0_ARAVE|nr:hypothetical protein AVEN_107165-1 [Araneus ventricosus]
MESFGNGTAIFPFRNNRASFNSRINQFITEHGPFVAYLHRFGLCSHDRFVCGDERDPNHYSTDCPVTKPFHFTKPRAKNLSTRCENIVQDKRSLARLMSIMKNEGMISSWIKKVFSCFHQQFRYSLQTASVYLIY